MKGVTKEMNVESAVQQAVDLNLFLYDRPLHPELFRHFASRRVKQGRYVADIWLVGLSHVVTVTCGGKSLVELVGPETEVLPTRGLLSRFRMKGERDFEKEIEDEAVYMVSTQVETMDDTLYKSVHNDLLKHAVKGDCFYAFDQWGDDDLTPFSYLDYDARDREFHVHAFHAFPDDCTIIKSQSIFELSK